MHTNQFWTSTQQSVCPCDSHTGYEASFNRQCALVLNKHAGENQVKDQKIF